MNKNKGIIGIGLILAIVLGIVVVGGGAYYLGKSNLKPVVIKPENILPNNENQNIISTKSVVVPSDWKKYINTSVGFEFKYPPEIIIDSNKYKYNEAALVGFRGTINPPAGNSIDAKNIDESAKYDIGGNNHFTVSSLTVDGQDARVVCTQETELCTVNIVLPKPFKSYKYFDGSDRYFKFLVISGDIFFPQKYVNQILSTFKFTINSAPVKTVSTTLPQYVGTHSDCGGLPSCWPPVISNSTLFYSCVPYKNTGDVTDDVIQKNINGRAYCVKSFSDGYAGGTGWRYTYTTANGNGTKTTTFGLTYQSCGVYGGPTDPTVIQCKNIQSNFSSNLDTLIDSLMFN